MQIDWQINSTHLISLFVCVSVCANVCIIYIDQLLSNYSDLVFFTLQVHFANTKSIIEAPMADQSFVYSGKILDNTSGKSTYTFSLFRASVFILNVFLFPVCSNYVENFTGRSHYIHKCRQWTTWCGRYLEHCQIPNYVQGKYCFAAVFLCAISVVSKVFWFKATICCTDRT